MHPDIKQIKSWFIYMIKDAKGAIYTGITTDVQARFETHCSGKGAKYTRARKGLALIYQAACGDRSLATRTEMAVKRLDHASKLAIARGTFPLPIPPDQPQRRSQPKP